MVYKESDRFGETDLGPSKDFELSIVGAKLSREGGDRKTWKTDGKLLKTIFHIFSPVFPFLNQVFYFSVFLAVQASAWQFGQTFDRDLRTLAVSRPETTETDEISEDVRLRPCQ